jgi:hypothetical protein
MAAGGNGVRGQTGAGNLKVFISYSRKDSEAFADELVGALEFLGGFDVSIDRHSIAEGEAWKERLGALIAEADTVVFVISPSSIESPICQWEVDEATRLSKRILPVLWIAPPQERIPERLAALNFTRFDEGHSFIGGLKALVAALNTDIGWLREHTRLLTRALEWERANRIENRMLSGPDIADARQWAARRPKGAPEPTALHLDYIRASEQAEAARNDAIRRQNEERAELLRQAEAAAEERAQALTKAEQALKVTARLQRRQALGGALAVIFVVAAGWWAYGIISERRAVAREASREDIRGQVISYATARGEHAADTAEGYATSPYSTVVSGKIRQRNKNVVDALVDAHKEVTQLSAFHQRPFLSTSMNGHIYLAQQPVTRKKRAILVSVDDPNLGGTALLNAPKHDVEAIAAALLTVGFEAKELKQLHNADRAGIEAEIESTGREFAKDAQVKDGQPPPNTLLLFFFSGHGVEVRGLDYIIPRLAHGKADTPDDIARDAISAQRLTRRIDDIAAASIVILDTHFPKLFDEAR